MNYVIDPLWIYWLSVVSKLLVFSCIISVLCIIAGLIWFAVSYDEVDEVGKRQSKKIIITGIVLLFIAIFIPSKETMIGMLVAKNVTTDKVQVASKVIENVYNDILDVVKEKEGN